MLTDVYFDRLHIIYIVFLNHGSPGNPWNRANTIHILVNICDGHVRNGIVPTCQVRDLGSRSSSS